MSDYLSVTLRGSPEWTYHSISVSHRRLEIGWHVRIPDTDVTEVLPRVDLPSIHTVMRSQLRWF